MGYPDGLAAATTRAGRCLMAALSLCGAALAADGGQPAAPDSAWRNLAPRLYIQDETWADLDYVKTEVTFVNYVRDRTEADIHLTVTRQSTGSGGQEYCLRFEGLGAFGDIGYTLKHATAPDATADELRTTLVASIRRGLAPFLARTDLRDRLTVEFAAPESAVAVTDPWHNWVFSVSAYCYATGEKSSSTLYYYLYPGVSRVTSLDKLGLDGGLSVNERRFVDTTTFRAVSRSYSASAYYARKLSEHLAVGASADYSTSNYNNIRLGLGGGPMVELNLAPYSEYVKHKVYLQYGPDIIHRAYFDTTLYNLTGETRFRNELTLGAKVTRSWGSVNLSSTGRHYFHDFSKNRLSLYADATLRVVAGLSLSLSGGYDFIHDQLGLRKSGATEQERLLRLRELATGYSYWTAVSVTYTFGSVYNNIVNPIF